MCFLTRERALEQASERKLARMLNCASCANFNWIFLSRMFQLLADMFFFRRIHRPRWAPGDARTLMATWCARQSHDEVDNIRTTPLPAVESIWNRLILSIRSHVSSNREKSRRKTCQVCSFVNSHATPLNSREISEIRSLRIFPNPCTLTFSAWIIDDIAYTHVRVCFPRYNYGFSKKIVLFALSTTHDSCALRIKHGNDKWLLQTSWLGNRRHWWPARLFQAGFSLMRAALMQARSKRLY